MPYKAIEQDTGRFVDEQFLPPNFTIKDPKKLKKDASLKLIKHILQRQVNLGAEEAFRFRIFQNSKGVHVSRYPGTQTVQRKRKAKKIKKATADASAADRNASAAKDWVDETLKKIGKCKGSKMRTENEMAKTIATADIPTADDTPDARNDQMAEKLPCAEAENSIPVEELSTEVPDTASSPARTRKKSMPAAKTQRQTRSTTINSQVGRADALTIQEGNQFLGNRRSISRRKK